MTASSHLPPHALPTHPTITEDDIVAYLVETPDFFARHAQVLASVRLVSPLGQRAVSLPERQAEMMREKIRSLELKFAELLRFGKDNQHIAEQMHRWSVAMIAAPTLPQVVDVLTQGVYDIFGSAQLGSPMVGLRVWGDAVNSVAYDPSGSAPLAVAAFEAVTPEVQRWVAALQTPFCDLSTQLTTLHPEAAPVLDWCQSSAVQSPISAECLIASLALLPLRGAGQTVVGALVIGSENAHRFGPSMGHEFLNRMAELASAALQAHGV